MVTTRQRFYTRREPQCILREKVLEKWKEGKQKNVILQKNSRGKAGQHKTYRGMSTHIKSKQRRSGRI